MIDKLHLRVGTAIPDTTIEHVVRNRSLSKHGILDKNYSNAIVLRNKGGHLMSIKRSPNLPNHYPTYLELNPRRFKGHKSLLMFLKDLEVNPDEAQIRRIDHSADMNINIELIRRSLIVKRKRRRTDFHERDFISGLYFGSGSEVIAIYNKSLEQRNKRNGVIQSQEPCTRFEVRQKAKKIKYHWLSQLHKYLDYNPFSSLSFYDLHVEECTGQMTSMRDQIFQNMLEERGLHSTYKILNHHNNFKRDFNNTIMASNYSGELTDTYHNSLRSYLYEQE